MIVCVGTVNVDVENAACPLPLSAVGPASMVVGKAQVPPSIKVTLPLVTAAAPIFTEAVNVTLFPKIEGFVEEATVVVVAAFPLKVAVRSIALPPPEPKLKVQDVIVPTHVVEAPEGSGDVKLHPVKTDPTFGVTVRVPVALLFRLLTQGFGVPLHGFVVGVGLPVTAEREMEPPPVPAKVIVKFLLS